MQDNISTSITKTLSYADIFEFPMTFNEIHKFFIGKKVSKEELKEGLRESLKNKKIEKKEDYYFLRGRKNLVNIRKERVFESRRKIIVANRFSRVLRFIPTIELIGISGSLAMRNSGKKDDIDFFIITKPNTVWITRFLVQVLLILFKPRISDKLCPNMYISLDNLKLEKNTHNLFTAHEASQLKVVFDRGNVYGKFLELNSWINKFLPNIKIREVVLKRHSFHGLIKPLDRLLFFTQYLYMKPKITKEKVGKNQIRFHDKNKGKYVLEIYKIKTNFYLKKEEKINALKFAKSTQILQDIDLF